MHTALRYFHVLLQCEVVLPQSIRLVNNAVGCAQ